MRSDGVAAGRRRKQHTGPFALALLTGAALVLIPPATGLAADPQLRSIVPWGGRRGTEVELRISGARLADAEEILFYSRGIEVLAIEPVENNANRITARVKVAGDCRLGPHGLRVRTASGLSNLMTWSVGALPVVDEAEPNSEFDAPQAIEPGTTVHGTVENEDVDYFAVEAKKGERLSVEIEGIRLGSYFFDPAVAILNAERFVLAAGDDTPLVYQDAVCSVVAPDDGPYVIEVRESAYGGNGQCRYRLHVGRFPRPLAVFPPGGQPGETLEVRWLGDAAGEWTEQVTLPEEPGDDFGLLARDEHGPAPSPNPFRVSPLPCFVESEPNNSEAQATPFEAPAAVHGVLAEPDDRDSFRFAATKGQVYDVRVLARELRSPIDAVLGIRQVGGGGVASNDDSGGFPDSYARFTAPADAEYVLTVRDHLGRGGPQFVYRVALSPVEPKLTLALPERRQNEDVVAAVPQGNHVALMVQARRENFGGQVELQLAGLPPGVTAKTFPIADGESTVPLLLTAAGDAKPAGALVELTGRHQGESRTVEGRLLQQTSLVRGQNNRQMLTFDARRMATAVTQRTPFSIELAQPKAPLVRDGSMNLKVKAARDEGFDAEIALEMLYDPSGLSASRNVKIAKGQTEADLPVTANGSAKLGTWPVGVLARATAGDGPVVISSGLADLEVAEPFVEATISPAAVEQGQPGQVAVTIEKKKDFPGAATLELVGLPANVSSGPQEITAETTEVTFPLTTSEKSPPGHHKSLRCRVTITVAGEPVVGLTGSGELRIRRPPPEKPAEPKEEAKPEPKPEEPPAEKPLSRLEQLRLEREQRGESNKE